MNNFQIPQKKVEGHMMPRTTFDLVSEILAKAKFEKWCEELGVIVNKAMNEAVNCDNRLSYKTREKIFNNFVSEVKREKRALKFM